MREHRRATSLVVVLSALLPLAGGPRAAARALDLRDLNETKLVATVGAGAMSQVRAAGDVNGDGAPDLLVAGSPGDHAGVVRVFFGPVPRGRVSLDESPERGFSIHGAGADDYAQAAFAAGDVNGDALGDVIVGAFTADNNQRAESGTAYVVFGKSDRADVDLGDFDEGTQGGAGFRIDGPDTFSLAGIEVAGLGDTDGDGLSDVVVGAVFAGSAYVVRGKTDSLPVDLMTFDLGLQGDAGFRIDHHVPDDSGQYRVRYAGDVNGDGLGDVALATARESVDYDVWVVFGKGDNEGVDVAELGERGFELDGRGGDVGMGLSNAGDVNGDGRDDLVVGAGASNRAWLVFGRSETSPIVMDDFRGHGFVIYGVPRPLRRGVEHGRTGEIAAGASDMNGDGLSDFVVSAYDSNHRGRRRSGSVFLLFGKKGTRAIRLEDLGHRGIRIDGERERDQLGIVPAMPGDVTGDGRPDLAIGAPSPRRRNAGQVHVVSHRMLF